MTGSFCVGSSQFPENRVLGKVEVAGQKRVRGDRKQLLRTLTSPNRTGSERLPVTPPLGNNRTVPGTTLRSNTWPESCMLTGVACTLSVAREVKMEIPVDT